MDVSSERSLDEHKGLVRNPYRVGHSPPPGIHARADVTRPVGGRKRVLVGLDAAAWLLMLGGIFYCLFLPDLEEMPVEEAPHDPRIIREDPNLSPHKQSEKSRENSKQAPEQGPNPK